MNILKFNKGIGAKKVDNLFEDPVMQTRIRTDHDGLNNRALPKILIAGFCNRNRKVLPDAGEETLENLPLVLQRTGIRNEENEDKMSDGRALLRISVMRISFQAFRPLFPGRSIRSCHLS